ncbi:MAG TPA: MBL fold metallo-hydrolase [Candidatus Binatia bacterium]|nr:MBL fold metallo-hydrolase [Candidatus Binatia bacterium]
MTVTLDWLGCATFRLAIGELVVFLDAYVDRVPSAQPTGLTIGEIDRADWIVIGHSHFDHLYGAERIARATGATVIGSYETVRILQAQGIPQAQMLPVAGGEKVRLSADVTVDVFPSQHSCVWSHRAMPAADAVCLGDLGVTLQEQQRRMQELFGFLGSLGPEVLDHLRASAQGALGDGGALLFLFQTPDGSLLYQDTSGCWSGILRDLRPDVAILAAAGRGNLDGEPIQGSLARFVAREAELLRPRRIVLSHHDDWLPGFSRAVDVAPIRVELSRVAPAIELVEMGYRARFPLFGPR